jgi:hypothetical protein
LSKQVAWTNKCCSQKMQKNFFHKNHNIVNKATRDY